MMKDDQRSVMSVFLRKRKDGKVCTETVCIEESNAFVELRPLVLLASCPVRRLARALGSVCNVVIT